MAIQDLNESFWRSAKFFLLSILAISILYINLTKFMLKIPVANNKKLLSSITEFEKILENEKKITEKAKELSKEIEVMEFDIYQVQKQDDIKREIFKIESIYKESNLNSKYKFSSQLYKILSIYYNTRDRNSKLNYNMDLISKNLTECQANL
jgi:hypothetical protein